MAAGGGPGSVETTRVLIVDDHAVLTASLAMVIEAEPDLAVVGTASSAAQALELTQSTHPHVVLLDHRLPDADGVDIVPRLVGLPTAPRVVMLTAATSDEVLLAAIEAGVRGFLDKTRGVSEVLEAVRAAAAGGATMSPDLLARLLPRLRPSAGRQGGEPGITDREREVLRHLARGRSNAEIARELTLSVHTVRNHVANLSAKLGAHSKLEVLAIAVRRGLVEG